MSRDGRRTTGCDRPGARVRVGTPLNRSPSPTGDFDVEEDRPRSSSDRAAPADQPRTTEVRPLVLHSTDDAHGPPSSRSRVIGPGRPPPPFPLGRAPGPEPGRRTTTRRVSSEVRRTDPEGPDSRRHIPSDETAGVRVPPERHRSFDRSQTGTDRSGPSDVTVVRPTPIPGQTTENRVPDSGKTPVPHPCQGDTLMSPSTTQDSVTHRRSRSPS